MSEDYRLYENQIVPMDHKRALKGERFEYDSDKFVTEQNERRLDAKTGFTTEVVIPNYGIVREREAGSVEEQPLIPEPSEAEVEVDPQI